MSEPIYPMSPQQLTDLMAGPDFMEPAVERYNSARAWHELNMKFLVIDPEFVVTPPHLVMLGVDPMEIVHRASMAELLDPTPPEPASEPTDGGTA